MSKQKEPLQRDLVPTNGGTHNPHQGKQEVIEKPAGTLVPVEALKAARRLDEIASEVTTSIAGAGHMERMFIMSAGITALREALTPQIMERIMPLMNSPNGFKTDRDPSRRNRDGKSSDPYPVAVVKECMITSLLLGLYPVNNEWNIIAGQCYPALNGWKRKFEQIPGISDIVLVPGNPTPHQKVAIVRVALSWKLNGVPGQLTDHEGKPGRPFSITFNGYEGIDQLIGKAKARAYRAAFEQATGSVCTIGIPPDEDAPPTLPEGYSQPPSGADRIRQELADRRRGEQPDAARPARAAQQPSIGDEIRRLIAELGITEAEIYDVCEKLEIPGNFQNQTQPQQEAFLAWLKDEQGKVAGEMEQERAAMQGI